MTDESQVLFVLNTIHKAKGREGKRVKLANDFGDIGSKETDGLLKEEINLLYIACMRAKETLDKEDYTAVKHL